MEANPYKIYKNTKLKLLKTKAAVWFNKICRNNHLRPKYISLNINGHTQQVRRTEANAIRFRISQEIKFQYKKKQHLNQQLYHSNLKCAQHYSGMWQDMHMILPCSMLPHNHDGWKYFLNILIIFNISNFNKEENKELPEDDLIEDRNMLECFLKCFKWF